MNFRMKILCGSMFFLLTACGGSGGGDGNNSVSDVGSAPNESDSFLTIDTLTYDDILYKADDKQITIYIKSENSATWSDHFLEYNLVQYQDVEKRMDLWRLVELYDVIPSQESSQQLSFIREYNGEPIANIGEWECAIIEAGASDYMGGFHGYEELSSYKLVIDGESVTNFSSLELAKAKKIEFIQESNLISRLTGEVAAVHVKEYSFSTEKLEIMQTVEWKIKTNINQSYLAMLPIKRNLYDFPEVQITDEAYRENTGTFEYIATGDFDMKKTNDEKIYISGDDSGFSANVTLERNIKLPGYSSYISNAPQYNKLYFDFSGVHTTSVGEKWITTSSYDLYINRSE